MEQPDNHRQFLGRVRFGMGRPGNRGQFHGAKWFLPKGRRRGPGSMPAPVEPPRGPLPLQGGAEAPLEFGD